MGDGNVWKKLAFFGIKWVCMGIKKAKFFRLRFRIVCTGHLFTSVLNCPT